MGGGQWGTEAPSGSQLFSPPLCRLLSLPTAPHPLGGELLVGGPPLAAGCPWLALAHTSGMLLGDTLSGPPTPPVSLDFLALPTTCKGEFSPYTPMPMALLSVLSLLGPPTKPTRPRLQDCRIKYQMPIKFELQIDSG